ncbi:hypothetical protein HA402_003724 [Bradysia odoriphaga]|nr:hypothetical protein HA402_003724 [Bradysia odoriphaga]
MIKLIFVIIVSVAVKDVHLQRSSYAGSANKFRGQPVNLEPEVSSVPMTGLSPSIATQARSIPTTGLSPSIVTQAASVELVTSATATSTTPIPITQPKVSLLSGRFGGFDLNQNNDQYRDYYQHRHHQGDWRKNRRDRDFDYGFF